MVSKKKILEFEWDKGNLDKSYQKHGITTNEAEEIFLDDDLVELNDIKHSQVEKRFLAIGKTFQKKILLAAFTVRKNKIRIISIRRANNKERRIYSKKNFVYFKQSEKESSR